jgi:hypothetical protein
MISGILLAPGWYAASPLLLPPSRAARTRTRREAFSYASSSSLDSPDDEFWMERWWACCGKSETRAASTFPTPHRKVRRQFDAWVWQSPHVPLAKIWGADGEAQPNPGCPTP